MPARSYPEAFFGPAQPGRLFRALNRDQRFQPAPDQRGLFFDTCQLYRIAPIPDVSGLLDGKDALVGILWEGCA